MLGLFGIFGRSIEVQRLDDALRAVGVHPRAVSDAVKIATLKQLKQAAGGTATPKACAEAAVLLGYCLMGGQAFALHNGVEATDRVESRLLGAIESGRNLDARLVLLALHAGMINPHVIVRFELSSEG